MIPNRLMNGPGPSPTGPPLPSRPQGPWAALNVVGFAALSPHCRTWQFLACLLCLEKCFSHFAIGRGNWKGSWQGGNWKGRKIEENSGSGRSEGSELDENLGPRVMSEKKRQASMTSHRICSRQNW